ncbi:MAG: mechanosensitive ion channel family protein [Chlorobiota bacterium]|jgi:small conductance mechanosensitive channel|nr:mechanosensitive ion channel family protein [Chlorobiota bacterium]QQS65909.1 MAG: mechanosensitive ion channel family protein [Chlorobiota bacterium]
MNENFSDLSKYFSLQTFTSFAVTFGLRSLSALIILFVGYFLIRICLSILRRASRRVITDITISRYLFNSVRILLWSILILTIIGLFGIPTLSFATILGALTLAVGLGVQGSLTNFSSGLMLLLLRPFKTGDNIEVSGIRGNVIEIGMFATEISTKENSRAYIPNSSIFSSVIINRSKTEYLKLEMMITVSENTDINRLQQICQRVLVSNEYVLENPRPEVSFTEANRAGITISIKPSVNVMLADTAKSLILKNIREELSKDGIVVVMQ